MGDRLDLIARKQDVRSRIERLRRQLAQEMEQTRSPGERAKSRRIRRLESQLEQLMAEEYRLRVAIDQSRE